jgi:hypothetical protein
MVCATLQELRISCAGSSHLSLEDPVFFEDAEAAAKASSSSVRSGHSLFGGGCAEVGGQVLLLLAQGCQQLRRVTVSGAPTFRAEVRAVWVVVACVRQAGSALQRWLTACLCSMMSVVRHH